MNLNQISIKDREARSYSSVNSAKVLGRLVRSTKWAPALCLNTWTQRELTTSQDGSFHCHRALDVREYLLISRWEICLSWLLSFLNSGCTVRGYKDEVWSLCLRKTLKRRYFSTPVLYFSKHFYSFCCSLPVNNNKTTRLWLLTSWWGRYPFDRWEMKYAGRIIECTCNSCSSWNVN